MESKPRKVKKLKTFKRKLKNFIKNQTGERRMYLYFNTSFDGYHYIYNCGYHDEFTGQDQIILP